MADGSHICRQMGLKFGRAQLDHQVSILDKFKKTWPVVLEKM